MSATAKLPDTPLAKALFEPDDGKELDCYAVIDGAACPELLPKLSKHAPEHCCLYAGELEPDVEEVAPYLVKLGAEDPFTLWLLESIGTKPWGIFCRVDADLRTMRKHFRQFLVVKGPEGENLYFRYYDPRVLGMFLPTCDAWEIKSFFGRVESYVTQPGDADLLALSQEAGNLKPRVVRSTS